VHSQITALWSGRKVELRETRRSGNAVRRAGGVLRVSEVDWLSGSGWPGSAVSAEFSANRIDPVQTFTAFLLSVVAGARRGLRTRDCCVPTRLCGGCWA